jgi:predicted RNA-binding Zn ribbon-like protein
MLLMVTDVKVSEERWPRSVGGHVVLDLVNTDVVAQDDRPSDVLRSAAEFLAWCAANGVPSPSRSTTVDARALTERAGQLRTAVRRIVEALAAGTSVPADALDTLRTAYVDAVARCAPVVDDARLRWEQDSAAPDSPVGHLAVAAVDLLREGPTDRIKVCPSCGFAFLDTTKNRSRRWCSMDDCGKQEKMRRYVAKRARGRTEA